MEESKWKELSAQQKQSHTSKLERDLVRLLKLNGCQFDEMVHESYLELRRLKRWWNKFDEYA